MIAADTVVAVDGRVLGKPAAPEDAVRTLAALSGREHTVYTGSPSAGAGGRRRSMRQPPSGSARSHWRRSGPMSPPGSLWTRPGVTVSRDMAACWWEGIRGDYFNVVGLPVCKLGRMLARFGVEPLALAAEKEQTP